MASSYGETQVPIVNQFKPSEHLLILYKYDRGPGHFDDDKALLQRVGCGPRPEGLGHLAGRETSS